jgi:hypothetical protein
MNRRRTAKQRVPHLPALRGLMLIGLAVSPALLNSGLSSATPASSAAQPAPLLLAPPEVERRALRLLNERRALPESSWREASIVPGATPLLRPDMQEPAYWEFRLRSTRGLAAGFVIVAAGAHDHPIPLSSERAVAPTEQVRANARVRGQRVARFYMPVSGYVVGETEEGEAVVGPRGLPPKLVGFERAWLDEPADRFEGGVRWDQGKLIEVRPQIEPNITQASWGSWDQLKRDFAAVQEVPGEILRRGASKDWMLEQSLSELGEVLVSGERRFVPFLSRGQAAIRLAGDAPEALVVQPSRGPAGEHGASIEVLEMTETEPRFFRLELVYADGATESLRYGAVGSIPSEAGWRAGLPPSFAGAGGGGFAAMGRMPVLGATSIAPLCPESMVLVAFANQHVVPANPQNTSARPLGRIFDPWQDGSRQVVQLVSCGSDCVAIRAASTGKYWSSQDDGQLNANATTIGEREKFRVQDGMPPMNVPPCFGDRAANKCPSGGQTVTLPTINIRDFKGRYVTMRPDNTIKLLTTLDPVWAAFQTHCGLNDSLTYYAGITYQQAWASVPRYGQVPPAVSPNNGPCYSGCGSTAWTMLIGWADRVAHEPAALNHSIWQPHSGIYRQDGGKGTDVKAPHYWCVGTGSNPCAVLDTGVKKVVWEIFGLTNGFALTGCTATTQFSGQNYWTHPANMHKAANYFPGRAGVSLTAKYDAFGVAKQSGNEEIRDILRFRKRPVIIGEGVLTHYSVAIGYRKYTYRQYDLARRVWLAGAREHFETNAGWAGNFGYEVPYSTWFQGWLHPNTSGWDTHGTGSNGTTCTTEINCSSRRCDYSRRVCIP